MPQSRGIELILTTGTQVTQRRSKAVALGLVIERRGPDGAFHLALGSEGWNLHRAG